MTVSGDPANKGSAQRMIVKFSSRTADKLKPTSTRAEYFDEDVPGLALRVTPAGVKTWSVIYRHRNRRRRLTLGSAAVIGLADARTRARDVLHAASKGGDPAGAKQAARTVETMQQLADSYLELHAKKRKKSWKTDERLLRKHVLPGWQHRAVTDIARRDLIARIDAVAAKGTPISANRIVALLSKVFKFALDKDIIAANPAVSLPKPGNEIARDRVLTDDEIRTWWASLEPLEPAMAAFYKLRFLTLQRGGEVADVEWPELDLENGWWTIPKEKAKNGLSHRVPLNRSALALIKALQPPADDLEHAVASIRDADEAVARRAYVLAGARGKRQQAQAAATFTIADFRGHDLRRTAASIMASGGIPRLTIKKLLNHVETDITAVYDRHSYDPEKAAAVAWWDTKLAAILEKRAATVHAFAARA
jgi:integrase